MADSLLNLEDSLAETIKENEGGLVLEPYKLEYTKRDGTKVKENVYEHQVADAWSIGGGSKW